MRDIFRKHPALGIAVAVVLIAAAVGANMFWPSGGPEIPSKAFFTTDDGATTFADNKNLVPPVEQGGKTAVKAIVYRCRKHDKTFVNHLERYTPQARTAYAAALSTNEPIPMSVANGRQVKKPGSGQWVLENDAGAMSVIIPRCPEGDNDQLEGVTP